MRLVSRAKDIVARRLPRGVRPALRRAALGGGTRIVSQDDYAAARPGQWTLAYPAPKDSEGSAREFGGERVDFTSLMSPIPDLGVFALRRGRAVGWIGHAYTSRGELIRETTWYQDLLTPERLPHSFPRARHLRGTCLSLISDFAHENYAHFLLDSLGRIAIVRAAGFSLADFDHVYIDRPPSPTAASIARRLGLDARRCLWARDNPCITADTLFVTSYPGGKRNYARCVSELFSSFREAAPQARRRIWVDRKGTRRLLNEDEVLKRLEPFGFEVYDHEAVEDAASFFADAEIVVGPHGAGFANIVFCRPGTKVLELFPSDHVMPFYVTLCRAADLDHAFIIGPSVARKAPGVVGPSPYDFHVDAQAVQEAVGALLSQGAAS